jgi:hypothetical protein
MSKMKHSRPQKKYERKQYYLISGNIIKEMTTMIERNKMREIVSYSLKGYC